MGNFYKDHEKRLANIKISNGYSETNILNMRIFSVKEIILFLCVKLF